MIEFVAALIAFVSSVVGGGYAPPGVDVVATVTPADAPPLIAPADQPADIGADGTIYNADGTTQCVTASPCDFAAAGYQPGEIPPGEVDPIWGHPDLAVIRGADAPDLEAGDGGE